MRIFNSLLVVAAIALAQCTAPEKETAIAQQFLLPNAPKETERIIREAFPGAMPAHDFGDSIIHYLNTKYKIAPDNMLLGASTCVDDIIYTKNFHAHPDIKGPFHLGGLAGLPFTGVSGLDAFAHHVPDRGAMVLLVEPHIGYSEKGGWGYVLRHDQHESTSCCGALMGTLAKLKAGTLKSKISEEDYQGDKIGEFAMQYKDQILSSQNPIIELTRITSDVAEKQIRAHVLEVGLGHVKYIVIITGVIINTDYEFTDYQYVDGISVYDVSERKFVEELKIADSKVYRGN
jgi:hypothetical protein